MSNKSYSSDSNYNESSLKKSIIRNFKFKKNVAKITNQFFLDLSKNDKLVLDNYKNHSFYEINSLCRNCDLEFKNINIKEYNFSNSFLFMIYIYKPNKLDKLINPYKEDSNSSCETFNFDIYNKIIFLKIIFYHIKCLDNMFKNIKYTFQDLTNSMGVKDKNYKLYRGTIIPNINNYIENDTIIFNEYLSCSNNKKISLGFTDLFDSNHCFFIIKNVNKCPFIFLDWQVANKKNEELKMDFFDEFECVLPRGCQFKIKKIFYTTMFNKYYKILIKKHIYEIINKKIENLILYKYNEKELINMVNNINNQKLRVIELEFLKWDLPKINYDKLINESFDKTVKRINKLEYNVPQNIINNIVKENKVINTKQNTKLNTKQNTKLNTKQNTQKTKKLNTQKTKKQNTQKTKKQNTKQNTENNTQKTKKQNTMKK